MSSVKEDYDVQSYFRKSNGAKIRAGDLDLRLTQIIQMQKPEDLLRVGLFSLFSLDKFSFGTFCFGDFSWRHFEN